MIIDGGSNDGAPEIIERYQERLAYWHSRPDRRLADAWHQGIEHSSGRWLLFLNSDDYFCDNCVLSKLAQKVRQHLNADVVYGKIVFVSRELIAEPLWQPFGRPFRWSEFIIRNTIPHPLP